MTGLRLLALAAVVVSLSGPTAAQKRPYDLVMKEVGSTSGALRKSLESGDLVEAAAQGETLRRLFGEVEDFWAAFETKDAIDAARGAAGVAEAVAAAAKAKDAGKAQAAVAGLGAFCTACHLSHRAQMPDKTYRIRP